ncbi:MAG: hypothetical protein OEW21_08770 [Betaproteobacteria bacterium]|nr:hypothetical protein [Betaproteobacteria bacterium]
MVDAGFGYVQARLQARHAERLSEPDWAALGGRAALQAFIERARETGLRRWLRGISAVAAVHQIEQQLRHESVAAVERLARWVPPRWREAVECCAALVYLPLVQRLRAGGTREAWMNDEASFALSGPGWRARLAALADSGDPNARRFESWLAIWRSRWPPQERAARRRLDDVVARLGGEARTLAALVDRKELPARETWSRRRALSDEFARRFRADLLTPAAVFDALLLDALEIERLRAELVSRALYPGEGR